MNGCEKQSRSFYNYFGNWTRVIDVKTLYDTIAQVNKLYASRQAMTPEYKNIFKAFNLCPLEKLKVVILGYDPYPQKGVATGIAFGNKPETKVLSPSLEVLKEALISPELPHYDNPRFDVTLESWARQGVLLLNAALTTEVGRTGSHTNLWRPFISTTLRNLSNYTTGIIYVLLGQQAQSFEPYIDRRFQNIIKERHPAYYVRSAKLMPVDLFVGINKLLYEKNGEKIKWIDE